jgi:hypothetical protein
MIDWQLINAVIILCAVPNALITGVIASPYVHEDEYKFNRSQQIIELNKTIKLGYGVIVSTLVIHAIVSVILHLLLAYGDEILNPYSLSFNIKILYILQRMLYTIWITGFILVWYIQLEYIILVNKDRKIRLTAQQQGANPDVPQNGEQQGANPNSTGD